MGKHNKSSDHEGSEHWKGSADREHRRGRGDERSRKSCRERQRHSEPKSRNLRGHSRSQGAASTESKDDEKDCEEEGSQMWRILGIAGACLTVVFVCSTLACCFCCKRSPKSLGNFVTTTPAVVGIPIPDDVVPKA